jgi:F-type H+-transporting ATPase subunit a
LNPVNFIEIMSLHGKIPPVLVGAWLVMAILLVFALMARTALARAVDPMIPDEGITVRSCAEVITEGMAGFTRDLLGEHELGSNVRFFGSLFLFILFGNFLGLIPGMEPATADTDITWGLAVICFFFYLYQGFRHQGPGYLKSFLGPMRKLSWLPLMILMLLIEVIDNLARPFSLGIRLFANMFADHNVLGVFTGLTKLVVPIAFYALGSLVCVVQAFVFVLLAMIYVVMASHEH